MSAKTPSRAERFAAYAAKVAEVSAIAHEATVQAAAKGRGLTPMDAARITANEALGHSQALSSAGLNR